MSGKNIGILIKKPENVFSNGCIQQVLFLAKILRNAGRDVEFLAIEPGYTRFELTNDEVIFTDERTNFSAYECVILGSLVLLEKNNKAYIDNMVSYGIPIINLICGNVFILLQEEFVFNTHNIMHHYTQSYITENWVMEMYDYALDYIKLMSGKPTRIVPYVWDNDIIRIYITNNKLFTRSVNHQRNHSKVNLIFFEPNMSIHKNSLVPLLIANEYYKTHKDRLHKIYVFCGDKAVNNLNSEFLTQLEIVRDKRVEVYGRIIMAYILDNIEQNNPYLNIVVSYNMLNRLNFLHLELFDMGVPILHNCEPFKENGMYFGDFDLCEAVNMIETTRDTFDKQTYKARCAPIIERFASSNTERVADYRSLLDSSNAARSLPPPPSSKIEAKPESPKTPTIARFYQGEGYVTSINDTADVNALERVLKIVVNKSGHKKHCEIFVNPSINVAEIDGVAQSVSNRMNIRVFSGETTPLTESYGVHASSFKKVMYIDLKNFISMHDVKVYTK